MNINKYHRQMTLPHQGQIDVEEGHPDMSSSSCSPRVFRGRCGLLLMFSLLLLGFGGFCVAKMRSHRDSSSIPAFAPGNAPGVDGGDIGGPSMPAVVLDIQDRYVSLLTLSLFVTSFTFVPLSVVMDKLRLFFFF